MEGLSQFYRTFQSSSRCSSNGPAFRARHGLHTGAQPGGLPGVVLRPRGGPAVVRQLAEAHVAPAPLGAGPHLGHPLLGHGVWLLHGLERAGGLLGGGCGSPGSLCRAAGLELGMASHLLWQPTNGLGAGGSPADGWAGRSHDRGLAQGEPAGRPPALPVPGLAGLRGRAQLPCVAGQPRLARWPAARRMKARCPLRTPAAADQVLPRVVAVCASRGRPACGSVWVSPRGHCQLQRCPGPSFPPRNGVLRFLPCSKRALRTWEARSQIKFVTSWQWPFYLGGTPGCGEGGALTLLPGLASASSVLLGSLPRPSERRSRTLWFNPKPTP